MHPETDHFNVSAIAGKTGKDRIDKMIEGQNDSTPENPSEPVFQIKDPGCFEHFATSPWWH
jgi:hypothetical protein